MMDIVTALEKQRSKIRMTVNEERVFMVPLSLFRERPYKLGEALDADEYDSWLMVRQFRHAMDRAGTYLSGRDRSAKELERLLLRCGYLESTVEMVILKLKKLKYINDDAFAASWVQSRSHKALGKRRIEQELRQKGVSKEAAREALEQLDGKQLQEKADEVAVKLARKYENEEPRKALQKLMQALVRRGFDWDEARSAAQKALTNDAEESLE
jgi:Uncharacterized protein conserved in bacteria